jgi:thioredoxin 1
MGAATVNLTLESFESTVKKGGIVLIDFWAEWCGPCRFFAPIFDAASETHKDVTFAKVNTDEQQQLASAFNIRGIPTLMAFRDGILLFEQAGALPAPMLEELISKLREVNMDEVRKEIAEQEKAQPAAAEGEKAKA